MRVLVVDGLDQERIKSMVLAALSPGQRSWPALGSRELHSLHRARNVERSEMESDKEPAPGGRAGFLQVAKTMFFVLLMVGKKESWEKGGDAARMTPGQIVAGAIIGGIVVIAALIGLVTVVLA